jgi:hypothetical protein
MGIRDAILGSLAAWMFRLIKRKIPLRGPGQKLPRIFKGAPRCPQHPATPIQAVIGFFWPMAAAPKHM